MAFNGTLLHCPSCQNISACKVVSGADAGKEPGNWRKTHFPDISFLRRTRRCTNCNFVFTTVEVDEKLIDELAVFRFERNRKKDMEATYEFVNSIPWLREKPVVSFEMAQNFVRATAWWHTHSSGSLVRAKGFADRVVKSRHGWAVDFGANRFLIEKAIARSGSEISRMIQSRDKSIEIDLPTLKESLKRIISGAVANHEDNEYDCYYPLTGDDMMFGAHSIDVRMGADFLIRASGMDKFIDSQK